VYFAGQVFDCFSIDRKRCFIRSRILSRIAPWRRGWQHGVSFPGITAGRGDGDGLRWIAFAVAQRRWPSGQTRQQKAIVGAWAAASSSTSVAAVFSSELYCQTCHVDATYLMVDGRGCYLYRIAGSKDGSDVCAASRKMTRQTASAEPAMNSATSSAVDPVTIDAFQQPPDAVASSITPAVRLASSRSHDQSIQAARIAAIGARRDKPEGAAPCLTPMR
jgi:hypothetical protein